MSEPAVVRAVRGFKRGIDAREAHEMTLMAGRWARLEDRLQQHINNLMKELSEKRAAGIAVGEPMQLERYRALLAQTRQEIARYTAWAEARIDGERGELVELGARHAAEVLSAAGVRGGFNRLATPAIETMTAMLQQGAPLRELLEHVWPKSALGMSQALEDGIALGWGPMKTAREMMRGLESGLQRVLTIARTEQLRAYRTATNAQYRDSAVVTGWMWLCAKNMTVCAACLAMDGTEHPLSEEQQDHPNGGCTSVPILPGEKPEWQTGEKWFGTLSEADQRKLLGDKLYEAWDGGKGFEFSQLAQTAHSDTWGDSVRVARLDELERESINVMGYTWNREVYTSVADAMAAGDSDEGWVKYEQIFLDDYLARFKLEDDIERTLGLWGSPEPSFNAYLEGSQEQMVELAKAWGKAYEQDAMVMLLPEAGAEGGKLIWDFGRQLNNEELDALLQGVISVNRELTPELAKQAGFEDFMVGLTVKGRSEVEYWGSGPEMFRLGGLLINEAIRRSGLSLPAVLEKQGYAFRLLFKGSDYLAE